MQWAAKEAAASQIMLALEIMDTTFLNSITKYMEYEEKVGSPWFGVYPDLGNLSAWGNDVPKELEKGIHKIVGIHLKDTLPVLPEFPGRFKNVPFSEGCVDFSGCFSALERMGYRGPYLIEMWHRPEEDSREQVSAAKTYLEQQFLKAMEGQDNKTP